MSALSGEARAGGPAGPILVGVVGAPHGVRGEVRVKSYTERPAALTGYGPLQAGAHTLAVAAARPLKDDLLVVRFTGVDSREAAAALTGTRLFVDRAALPPPDEDEFYNADLIGLAAEAEDGAALGTVAAVLNHGAGDILEVSLPGGGATRLIAFTRAFVPVVDVPGGRVVVAAAALVETAEDEAAAATDDDDEGVRPPDAPGGAR